MIAFDGLWEAVTGLFGPVKELWNSLTDLYHTVFGAGDATDGFMRIILEVGDVVGQAFRILGAITSTVIGWFTDLIKSVTDFFKTNETARHYLGLLADGISFAWRSIRKYFSPEGFKTIFDNLLEYIDELGDNLMNWINTLTLGAKGITDDELKARQEELYGASGLTNEELDRMIQLDSDLQANTEGVALSFDTKGNAVIKYKDSIVQATNALFIITIFSFYFPNAFNIP